MSKPVFGKFLYVRGSPHLHKYQKVPSLKLSAFHKRDKNF